MKLLLYPSSHPSFSHNVKEPLQGRKYSTITSALPETAASVAVTATLVGAAVTLLVKRSKPSETKVKASCKKKIEFRECEDCAGSGICSECKGEGFVLKKLSEENAERARKRSQNMATRFTSGLPKKWSYCTKCTSSRSCPTCGGSGKLSI